MYDWDDDYRNFYDDDDFDGRNAVRRRRRRRYPGYGGSYGPRPYPVPVPAQPVQVGPSPWTMQPAPPPVVDRWSGQIRLGMILDAAAQILASMASLPSSPTPTGAAHTDLANLIAYQTSLAQHAKRDEQIRTVGALARLFLV